MTSPLIRAATATALALLPLALTLPAAAAPAPRAGTAARAAETAPLTGAVALLPIAAEDRTGYVRSAFRHWNAGLNPTDGCTTRNEVLLDEAVEPPTVGPGCTLTGGSWFSYYDEQTVTPAASLDIDHMVPLAEAWDSGASVWTAARREAYANDQGQPTSLIAVTARANRSKADQDPAEWLPPAPGARCRYLAEWTATKLRWDLAVDPRERDRLTTLATACPTTPVTWIPAP
ncbi:HNH endonuclease family protein [Streptomyces sp. NPDC057638]|uniref:HNH endonuclease family protein n=1 Tax=Streptomyces sp. NPDC057638 TaxID=3346190 RepID=UPI00369A8772